MDRIWWENIIKAKAFIQLICDSASLKHSILLSLPKHIPWKDTFVDIINEKLKMESPHMKLDFHECPSSDPGEFIFKKYCSPDIKTRYRPGKSYAQFLGQCQETVLNDRYVWIHNVSIEKIDKWINFVNEYNKFINGKEPGIFILEANDIDLQNKSIKGGKTIIYNNNISDYDRYAFCALLSSKTNCKDYIRPYFAELISSICGEDIELCANCVSKGISFLENPFMIVQQIVKLECREDGTKYNLDKKKEEFEENVWETQIKYAFPLIESFRKNFIKKYKKDIDASLPLQNNFGEKIERLEDVEIGMLKYLADIGKISITTSDYISLNLYRNTRNYLAHMKTLDNNVLFQILKNGKSVI